MPQNHESWMKSETLWALAIIAAVALVYSLAVLFTTGKGDIAGFGAVVVSIIAGAFRVLRGKDAE